mgnify:CR=1 FL=1|tara:strand:+ start:677 stop:1210 length:534 start_codon:yes stop_codon:yes gene_type:complete
MTKKLPFHSISRPPKEYNAANSISRMIEGLGFRYYWATEGLRSKDLKYRPSQEAKSTIETLKHLYVLSKTIDESIQNKVSKRPVDEIPEDFKSLRNITLDQLNQASLELKKIKDLDLENLKIVFERKGGSINNFPLWNLINGPIADALYHTGQIVSFRRSSGNPIPKGVNVFLGIKN